MKVNRERERESEAGGHVFRRKKKKKSVKIIKQTLVSAAVLVVQKVKMKN